MLDNMNRTLSATPSNTKTARKAKGFALFTLTALMTFALTLFIAPAQAHAEFIGLWENDEALPVPPASSPTETYQLKVNYVIDNAADYPEIADQVFFFGFSEFTALTSFWGIDQFTPVVSAMKPLSITTSGSETLTWTGQVYAGETVEDEWWDYYYEEGMLEDGATWAWPRKYDTYEDGSLHFEFMPVDQTSSHLSLMNIEYGAGAKPYTYDNLGISDIVCTPYNWVQMSDNNGEITLHFRYTGELEETHFDYDAEFSGSKKIDYLGDGVANQDTSRNGENDYRLYVTGSTKNETEDGYHSKNVIFVLDTSGSMRYEFGNTAGNRRIDTLKVEVANMINQLNSADEDNRFSIVQFSSDINLLLQDGNANEALSAVGSLEQGGGTDYYSALGKASEVLNQLGTENSVVIFVSDGMPTSFPEDKVRCQGGGLDEDIPIGLPLAVMAAENFPTCESFYSIYIGDDATGPNMLQCVTQHIEVNKERASVSVENPVEFATVIQQITARLARPSTSITLSDSLTSNVVYRSGSAKVTRKVGDGNTETLVNGKDYSLEYDAGTRTVKAIIDGSGTPFTDYTLSFDVTASVGAVRAWLDANKTYPDTGEADTDYGSNTTSSGQPGFFSNTNGEVILSWNGGSKTVTLPKPVIQIAYNPQGDANIKAHVTLYNMELAPNLFKFNLVDENGNVVATSGNDMNGDVTFPTVSFGDGSAMRYTIVPIIPKEDEPGYIKYLKYENKVINVTMESDLTGDDDDAIENYATSVKYEPEAHFYYDYQIRTRYE